MWALILLVLLNGIVPKPMLFEYRVDVGGLPINVLDVLTVIALIFACFAGRRQLDERTHPLLPISLGLFAVAAISGSIGGVVIDAVPRWIVTGLRNLATLPLVAFISYRLINSNRRVAVHLYAIVLSSLASGIIAMLFVSGATEDIAAGGTFNSLRSTRFSGDNGCAAAAVLLFSLVSGIRAFPRFLTLPVLVLAVLGALSLPHRSEWLVAAGTCIYATFFLYRRHIVRKLFLGTLAAASISLAVFLAVSAISRSTGHDYSAFVERRLLSFLPSTVVRNENKPWESRLPGIERELELWLHSPLVGWGFGIQDIDNIRHPDISGYRHNVWSSSLVEGGLAELAGMLCVVIGSIVVGFRVVKTGGDRSVILFGALASSMGVWAFLLATSSMSLNTQATAIISATIFGALLRARALQLADERERAENSEMSADDSGYEQSAEPSPVAGDAYYY